MSLNFYNSGPKICFEHVLDSLNFHTFNIKVKSFVTHIFALILSSLLNLPIFLSNLFWNSLHQTILVWKQFRRHFFLSQKLFHLNGVNIQKAVRILIHFSVFVDERIVNVYVFLIFIFVVLIFIPNEIWGKSLRKKRWNVINNRLFLFAFNFVCGLDDILGDLFFINLVIHKLIFVWVRNLNTMILFLVVF